MNWDKLSEAALESAVVLLLILIVSSVVMMFTFITMSIGYGSNVIALVVIWAALTKWNYHRVD